MGRPSRWRYPVAPRVPACRAAWNRPRSVSRRETTTRSGVGRERVAGMATLLFGSIISAKWQDVKRPSFVAPSSRCPRVPVGSPDRARTDRHPARRNRLGRSREKRGDGDKATREPERGRQGDRGGDRRNGEGGKGRQGDRAIG